MRIATYNVEWFDALFDDAGGLLHDDVRSGRYGITRAAQIAALGTVFRALDADAVLVIEAPDTSRRRSGVAALQTFAETFDLRARDVVMGYVNDTQQEIALMVDPDACRARHDPQGDDHAPAFDGKFHIDLDVDATKDVVRFSKPPLELTLDMPSGRLLRVIGAHLKSKAPHGARNHDEIMQISIANRRKQLAQAIWLRRRVDAHLAAGESVVVLGDLNDGPGLDAYENLFGRSSVEILLGEGEGALFDPHAQRALSARMGAAPTSSRFFLKDEGRYLQAMLDYIMVSRDLAQLGPTWHIWHPFDDPACWGDAALRDALLTASDHFPVTIDIVL